MLTGYQSKWLWEEQIQQFIPSSVRDSIRSSGYDKQENKRLRPFK